MRQARDAYVAAHTGWKYKEHIQLNSMTCLDLGHIPQLAVVAHERCIGDAVGLDARSYHVRQHLLRCCHVSCCTISIQQSGVAHHPWVDAKAGHLPHHLSCSAVDKPTCEELPGRGGDEGRAGQGRGGEGKDKGT